MKKKIFYLMLIMLVLVVSCGKKKESAGGGDGKEVVLRFSWWGGDTRHKATLDAIKLFEEKNPGIKIKAEYSGWDGHFEKLSTQITGNTAPDIMQTDWNWLYIFSKNGDGFYDLNELKDDFDVLISAVSNTPSALQYASINQMMRAVNDNQNNLFYCSEEAKKTIRKLSA